MSGRARRAHEPLLLLDSGNSRLKWALSRGPLAAPARFAASGAIDLASLRRSAAPLVRVLRAARRSLGVQTRIHACNVAGARIGQLIRAAAVHAGLPAPRFAHSAAAAGGVRNAYPEPWRLGVDRWVALIGARQRYPGRAVCIVAIGSALTIDLLDAAGRHRGGCILPAPRMMIESLLHHTAGIRRRAALSSRGALSRALASAAREPLFALATRAALLAGARYACAALIERAAQSARAELGVRPRLILAGGAADTVAPLLRLPHVRQDDLVLRGLSVLAQDTIA